MTLCDQQMWLIKRACSQHCFARECVCMRKREQAREVQSEINLSLIKWFPQHQTKFLFTDRGDKHLLMAL